MKYATPQNTKLGDTVLLPINGQFDEDELICHAYKVVLALEKQGEDRIVGVDGNGKEQEHLPKLIKFNPEIAFKYDS